MEIICDGTSFFLDKNERSDDKATCDELTRAVPQMQANSPGRQMAPTEAPTLEDDLLVAASRGQVELLRELLAAGAALHPDKDGRTALHYAAQEGHADTCIFLLARGCGLNSQDVMGYSPLLRAASQGARDVVQVLLEAGCDANLQDEHGNAAIHETCWNGFSKTAEMLVHHNCDVFLTNKAGFTALHLAAQNGHNESSRVLLYAGCNPDMKNNYGDTALHTAARYGHAGVARILISARCKLSEQNKNGDSALHIAAALKRRKIAKILVESGTDVELVNKQSETAMDVAKRKEHPEIMLIISTYAKPRAKQQHHHVHHPAVTFKEEIEMVDGPVVCADDQPTLKQEPPPSTRPEKEKKAGFFFSFKKKKKDKSKEKSSSAPTTPSSPGQKKLGSIPAAPGAGTPGTNSSQPGPGDTGSSKTAVHGFFSRYVPRDGVQFYRDLAGNIKQGPIGYAPVCQCGPSLRHLESALTTTKDSLHQRIDVSHHILSRRIDDIDMRTRPLHRPDLGRRGGYATDSALHQRAHREHLQGHGYHHHPHHHHHHHMHRPLNDADDDDDDDDYSGDEKDYGYENSLDMGIGSRDSRDIVGNPDMPEDLEYWLTDKLASYGHCLDHHHDDSALPPRNLFTDFPHSALAMGRLVRSRSDETLSASDYSGKFRKRDFYASRQAAMQQIRGWELPRNSSKPGRKAKPTTPKQIATDINDSNRTVATNSSNKESKTAGSKRVITQAQVHSLGDADTARSQPQARPRSGNNGGTGMLSPSTNSTTSPGTLASSTVGHKDNFRHDKVYSPVENAISSHSWREPLQQQERQVLNGRNPNMQRGSSTDRNSALQIKSDPSEGEQGEAACQDRNISNPPYPSPPRYQHYQSHQLDHNLSQTPQGQQAHSTSRQHYSISPQQSLHSQGPAGAHHSATKQEDISLLVPAGHQRNAPKNPFKPKNAENRVDASPRPGLTRHQDNYGVHYKRNRALSSDALNDGNYEDVDAVCPPPDIQRSRSVDNALEDQKPMPYSTGYSTDTGMRPTSNTALTSRRLNSPRGREAQSLSPAPHATTRYRLPETSRSEAANTSNPQWQQDHSRTSAPTPPAPTYKSLRPSNGLKQVTSSATVPSSVSGPIVHSDQVYGRGRQYVSSIPFEYKDSNGSGSSGKNECQSPSQSLETPTPPPSSGHGPIKECLQHDNALLSPHLPSKAASNGGREDSTCSSNQDSGYGQGRCGAERPFGGATDTSVGTPSSSFSIERSNTPSTSDSPYASQRRNGVPSQPFNSSLHNRMSQSGYVSGRGRTYSPFSSGPDGSFRSSSSESHRPEDIMNRSGGYSHERFNTQRGFSSPSNDSAVSGNSMNKNNFNHKSVVPSYVSQPHSSSDHAQVADQVSNFTYPQHYINANQPAYSNPHMASRTFTQVPYTGDKRPQQGINMPVNSNTLKNTPSRPGPTPPPKPSILKFSQNGSTQKPSTPAGSGYLSPSSQQPFSTNDNALNNQTKIESQSPDPSDPMSQSRIQAHVQNWYQKKLLEAAHRLRQSDSYSANLPSPPSVRTNHSTEAYSMGSTSSESARHAATSASSAGNNSSRSSNSHVFNGYSSSSPSPSPQGPKNTNYLMGRSMQPGSGAVQPPYHSYNQQQQSSVGQQQNNNSSYHNSINDDKNTYSDSSPYNRLPNPQFSSATVNHSSINSARSLPSPYSYSEATNSQYQSQRQFNSSQPYRKEPQVEEIYSKIQHRHQYIAPQGSSSSNFDPHNTNSNHYQSPTYGLTRVDGGPLRYDPIHGSDV